MIAKNTRFQILVAALAAASFILAAAVPASQQTTSSPTNVVAQKSKPISTQTIPQTPVASPTPNLRMPKDLALPANTNTLRPADIPEANLGELEKSFDAAAYRRAVKNGEMALKKEDWNNAALELQEALTLNPHSKELTYNLGIAKFRQGDFAEAEKLFKDSAETTSADLAAKSMFNEGNAIYANAVKNLEQSKTQTNPNVPPSAGTPQETAPDL